MKTSFFDIDNWKEIGVTLSRNKTRTFLTAFGIFWGTAMLAMLLGGSQGLHDFMSQQFEGFATNSAIVFSNRTSMSYKGFNKGTNWDIQYYEVETIRKSVPEIKAITAIDSKNVSVANRKNSKMATVQGCDAYFTQVMEPVVYSGRFINESDDFNERKVCVIGKQLASDLFNSEDPIGKFVSVAGIYYKIVGVAGQASQVSINGKIDEMLTIPSTTFRKSFNRINDVGALILVAEDGHSPNEVKPRIESIFRSNHPISPEDDKAIEFFNISEKFEMVDNLFLGITILSIFVGFGTLFAGIIGVGNIMWVIVKERTKEIGVRRAIGAKPIDIITQILSEGVALTFVAGIAGISFATLVLYVAQIITSDSPTPPHFQLLFSQAITIMILFMILGIAAGLIPSIKAMKIKPIEALNDK